MKNFQKHSEILIPIKKSKKTLRNSDPREKVKKKFRNSDPHKELTKTFRNPHKEVQKTL